MKYLYSGIALYPLNRSVLFWRDGDGDFVFEYDSYIQDISVDSVYAEYLDHVCTYSLMEALVAFVELDIGNVVTIEELLIAAGKIDAPS